MNMMKMVRIMRTMRVMRIIRSMRLMMLLLLLMMMMMMMIWLVGYRKHLSYALCHYLLQSGLLEMLQQNPEPRSKAPQPALKRECLAI